MQLLDFSAHVKGEAWKLETTLPLVASQIRNVREVLMIFLQKE